MSPSRAYRSSRSPLRAGLQAATAIGLAAMLAANLAQAQTAPAGTDDATAPMTHRHHRGQGQGQGHAPNRQDADAAPDTGKTTKPAGNLGPAQDQIIAVVNGQIITRRDVDDRARLFSLSTGLPMSKEVQDRLRPQITRQLIDEKLRMQEIQQRHINIPLTQIANAIADIEKRNGMRPNALRDKLAADGVSMTTLIDQIRVQLAWTGVLREQLGDRSRISSNDIRQNIEATKSQIGQPEYQISEIFVPVEDPKNSGDALRFADTVIGQLRAGAPFPIVAAQFSQSQTALEGGALGWVRADTLDPEVVAVASAMPVGAVSNPIRVAGGYDIITLGGRREVGKDLTTVLDLRQAFIPFSSPLNPQAPTPQQEQALQQATALSKNARSCDAIDAANKSYGEKRPSNPGSVELDRLNPQMANVLQPLPVNQASHPLVSGDGIDVIMVCARSQKNRAELNTEGVADQLLNQRVELVSRQLNRDLHRKAVIDMRQSS